jgi:hypothetical protein
MRLIFIDELFKLFVCCGQVPVEPDCFCIPDLVPVLIPEQKSLVLDSSRSPNPPFCRTLHHQNPVCPQDLSLNPVFSEIPAAFYFPLPEYRFFWQESVQKRFI